jgi:hypothetical protein
MVICVEIWDFKIFTFDLKLTHSNENAKTYDKVDFCSYLQSLIFVDKQQLEEGCTVNHYEHQ